MRILKVLWILLYIQQHFLVNFCEEDLSSNAETHIVHATIGNSSTQLKFIGPRADCSFELFSNLDDNIQEEVIDTETVHGYLLVVLNIKHVDPSDAGIYSCQFKCENVKCDDFPLMQTTHLYVNHPPSPANCTWQDQNISNPDAAYSKLKLTNLLCNFVNGYPDASTLCYSQYKNRTKIHAPKFGEGKKHYKSLHLLNKKTIIHCCSVSNKYIKKLEDCQDFIWYPETPTTNKPFEPSAGREPEGGRDYDSPISSTSQEHLKTVLCLTVSIVILILYGIHLLIKFKH